MVACSPASLGAELRRDELGGTLDCTERGLDCTEMLAEHFLKNSGLHSGPPKVRTHSEGGERNLSLNRVMVSNHGPDKPQEYQK